MRRPRRALLIASLLGIASVAVAQTPCEDHCRERLDDCEATCRARPGDEREICWDACRVEARACTGLCHARGR